MSTIRAGAKAALARKTKSKTATLRANRPEVWNVHENITQKFQETAGVTLPLAAIDVK
jgi:hypothetical protein